MVNKVGGIETDLECGSGRTGGTGRIRKQMLLLFHSIDRLQEGPNIVVCKSQRLNFREFGLFWKSREDGAQAIQGVVEHVHPVTLPVVGFDAARLLDADQLRRTPGSNTRFTVALLLHRNPR